MHTNASTKNSRHIAKSPAKIIGRAKVDQVEVFTPTHESHTAHTIPLNAMTGDVLQYFIDFEVDADTRCILRAKLRGVPRRG